MNWINYSLGLCFEIEKRFDIWNTSGIDTRILKMSIGEITLSIQFKLMAKTSGKGSSHTMYSLVNFVWHLESLQKFLFSLC